MLGAELTCRPHRVPAALLTADRRREAACARVCQEAVSVGDRQIRRGVAENGQRRGSRLCEVRGIRIAGGEGDRVGAKITRCDGNRAGLTCAGGETAGRTRRDGSQRGAAALDCRAKGVIQVVGPRGRRVRNGRAQSGGAARDDRGIQHAAQADRCRRGGRERVVGDYRQVVGGGGQRGKHRLRCSRRSRPCC